LINAALGAATAAALWFMGTPDPLLWGGVVALLNYAPYVGPALTAIALTVVGFYQSDQVWTALAAPGMFLALHMIEGQLVTPHLACSWCCT
jgi:predicted PurR-regulated permease PerM